MTRKTRSKSKETSTSSTYVSNRLGSFAMFLSPISRAEIIRELGVQSTTRRAARIVPIRTALTVQFLRDDPKSAFQNRIEASMMAN